MARKRVALCIAYDGSRYLGWQRQGSRLTLQKALEDVLEEIHAGRYTMVKAASRTDAKVHAQYQIVVFQTDKSFDNERWRYELNFRLPPDIRVRKVFDIHPNFDPRADSYGKHYRYLIWEGDTLSPMWTNRAWQFPKALDIPAMQEAAKAFIGTHDFDSFRSPECEAKSSQRELWHVSIQKIDSAYLYPFKDEPNALIAIDVLGSAFLKHMIRYMVAALVEVGTHRQNTHYIEELLQLNKRGLINLEAPAYGLTLMKIFMSQNERDKALENLQNSPKI